MQEMIAYEARKLNRDPKLGNLLNDCFMITDYDDLNVYMWQRIYTIYMLELITTDLYLALEKALEAFYN